MIGAPLRIVASLLHSVHDYRYRRRCIAGAGARVLAKGTIANQQGRHAVTIGRDTWIAGELLVYSNSGRISIGDNCFIGAGSRIWSAAVVHVGHRVLVSHGVNIHDNNSHSSSADARQKHFEELRITGMINFHDNISAAPITIEDDAWIGFNAVVLKGVRLGKGSIVGAASVVTRDVAPYAIVAGNPAVVIGEAKP